MKAHRLGDLIKRRANVYTPTKSSSFILPEEMAETYKKRGKERGGGDKHRIAMSGGR